MAVVISADLVTTTKKTGKHQTTGLVWRPGCIYNIRNLDSLEALDACMISNPQFYC